MRKKMLTMVVLTLIASTAVAQVPAAKDEKTALALQLIEVTHFDRTIQNMRTQVRSMASAQLEPLAKCEAAKPVMTDFGNKLGDITAQALESDDFKVDVAAVYAEVFSADELKQIIDFYKSPLGVKLLDKMPQLMQKAMLITQDRMKSVMPKIEQLGEEYGKKATSACNAGTPAQAPAKK